MIKTIPETKWFPIFRAGRHTSADGTTRDWTESDLDRIVEANAERLHQVPLVVGHPDTASPKYGTLGGLCKRTINGVAHLFAKGANVVEQFADAVKARMYDSVSISVFPDGRLEHIGFLGAAAPAIEGFPPVQFANGEQAPEHVMFRFASPREQSILREIVAMLAKMRDYVIGKDGIESADQVFSADRIQWLYADIEKVGESPIVTPTSFTQPTGGGMDPNLKTLQDKVNELAGQVVQLTTENTALKGQVAQFSAKVEQLTTANRDLSGKLTAQEKAQRAAQFAAYADGLVTAGRLLPANKDLVVGLLDSMAEAAPYQFTKDMSRTPVDALKMLLDSYPQQINFGQVVTPGGAAPRPNNSDSADIAQRALQYQKSQKEKGIEVSIAQAVTEVTKG